jgi:hypothetical protein
MGEDWNKVICIDAWAPDESYDKGLYPEGTRVKSAYFSPADVGASPLRPAWRYLFKQSRSWAPWQFWMEVMAYRIGQVMGVPVPPAYVGLTNIEKPDEAVCGALIEWFYGPGERYIVGSLLIGPTIPGFDYDKGIQHNLQSILDWFLPPLTVDNQRSVLTHWAQVLTFDAVIGNTDRHQENWGIVLQEPGVSQPCPRFSPAFDNGTALAYEQREERFDKFEDQAYLLRYLTSPKQAKHHMRWNLDDECPMSFHGFVKRYAIAYPETKQVVLATLEFRLEDLQARLVPLLEIPVAPRYQLTKRRLDFTLKLIMKRVDLLRAVLE